jgi:hypothetical protein
LKDQSYPIGKPVGVIEAHGSVRKGHYANKKGVVIIHADDKINQLILFHGGRGHYRSIKGHLSNEELRNLSERFIKEVNKIG